MKSHLDKKGPRAIQDRLIKIVDLAGNSFADTVAEQMQDKVKGSYATIKEASRSFCLAFSVATRLAIIQANEWEERGQNDSGYGIDKMVKKVEINQVVKNSIALLSLRQGGHRLVKTDKGHRCEKCFKQRAVSNFRDFMTYKCQPKATGRMIINRKRKLKEQGYPVTKHGKICEEAEEEGAASAAAMPSTRQDILAKSAINQLDNPECDMFESEPESLGQHESPRPEPHSPKKRGFTGGLRTKRLSKIIRLGSKQEAKDRRRLNENNRASNASSSRLAETHALNEARNSIGIINDMADRQGYGEDEEVDHDKGDQMHPSHDFTEVHGEPNAVYCKKCAAWHNGGTVKALGKICRGFISDACKFQHRLLECGVIPHPGANIPEHARKTRRKTPHIG